MALVDVVRLSLSLLGSHRLSAYWASFRKDPGMQDIRFLAGRFWNATWVDGGPWLKGAVTLACGLGWPWMIHLGHVMEKRGRLEKARNMHLGAQ